MDRLPVRIGARVAVSRPARARSFLFLAVGGIATLCALTFVSGLTVRSREASRAAALEPVFGEIGEPGVGWTSLTQDFHGRSVLLIRLASRPGSNVRPPGLEALPAPGSLVVSRRLAAVMSAEPELRDWFASPPIVTLPREGVGSGGELRAYIGVDPDSLGSVEQRDVVNFGAARPSTKGFGWYEAAGFALFVALPAAGVLVTSSRFGRRSRNERNLALRLAGMSTAGANTVGAIEVGLPVAAGSMIAAFAYSVLLPDFMTLPVADRAVFGADARPPLVATVGVVVVVSVLAALLGAGSASRASTLARLGQLLSPGRLAGPRSLGVFAAGVVAAAAAWVRADARDPILWIAILLLGAGLPGATACTAQLVARVLARPQASLARLIAMRRIAADPQATTRIAGTVAIAVFVVGAAQPITQVLATPTLGWVATALDAGQDSVLGRVETLEVVPLELTAHHPPGVSLAVPAAALWTDDNVQGRPDTAALIATCDQLRELVEAPLPTCVDERRSLRTAGSVAAVPRQSESLMLRSADGRSQVAVDAPPAVLELPEDRLPVDASVLLPPNDPALAELPDPYIAAAYVRVRADEHAWEAARSWVIASSPAYRLENAFEASATVDSTGSWVLLGLIVTAGITALAAMLIAGDESGRRREWFGLQATGMSRSQLVTVQVVESITTGLIAMLLAVMSGIAVGAAFLQVGEESLPTNSIYPIAGIGGLAAVLVATLVTSAAVHVRARA